MNAALKLRTPLAVEKARNALRKSMGRTSWHKLDTNLDETVTELRYRASELDKLSKALVADYEILKNTLHPDISARLSEAADRAAKQAKELRETTDTLSDLHGAIAGLPVTYATTDRSIDEAKDYLAHLADDSSPNPWGCLARDRALSRISEMLCYPEVEE